MRIYYVILVAGILSWQCANRIGLEGGVRDKQPPMLDTESSDPNYKRNFNGDEFQLSFDEFVKIDKANEQIIVSPPLQFPLSPVVRGKKIIFRFNPDEELRENTTYTVQFGDAIQDITESNPVNNLRYIFSTGNVIDSMQIRVQVLDLENDNPMEDVWVMLYETLSDTVIRKGRPVYFSKSDSSGYALVENCRPGGYRIFALKDENRNYQFDLTEEKIGHIDRMVPASLDEEELYRIYLYSEVDPPYRLDAMKIDSQIYSFTIGGEIEYLEWKTMDGTSVESYLEKDTLFIKSNGIIDTILLYSDYNEPDTISLLSMSSVGSENRRFNNLKKLNIQAKRNGNRISASISWNNPVTQVNPDLIYTIDRDSNLVRPPELIVDSFSVGANTTSLSWKNNGMRDTVILFSNAVTSWLASNDTIVEKLRPIEEQSLSNLLVEVTNLDTLQSYILFLKSTKGEIVESTVISNRANYDWTAGGLFPSKYTLELVTDINGNGRADNGWFDKRQLPEPISSLEIDNLRSDWDVQVAIKPRQ